MTTQASLPPRLARLNDLASNLWWTWHPSARELFEKLDPETWDRVNHNPLKLVRELSVDKLQALSNNKQYLEQLDRTLASFDSYMQSQATWYKSTYPQLIESPIAYFSAEFGLHESLPIYSGGLGILSGDHTKEASDLGLPFVGVGFLYPQGYFKQVITTNGDQEASYVKVRFAEVPAQPAFTSDGK